MTRGRAWLVVAALVASACGGDAPRAGAGANAGAKAGAEMAAGAATSAALDASTAAGAASDAGAAASATTPASAAGANAAGAPCYLRDVWDECTLIKRLESQGYVPRVDGRDAGKLAKSFTAPYVELLIGRGRLRAFIYPTVAAAKADLARADTVGQGVCPPPRTSRYGGTLLHSANLIAFLEAENDNTCVRVGDLISAGLPQYAPK